jgi:hypothetical protein
MDQGLPLVPVVAGMLFAYAAQFAYTVYHHVSKASPPQHLDE